MTPGYRADWTFASLCTPQVRKVVNALALSLRTVRIDVRLESPDGLTLRSIREVGHGIPGDVDSNLIYIEAVHMAGGRTRHEDIEKLRWWQPEDSGRSRIRGEITTLALIEWMRRNGGRAKVVDEYGADLEVRVVEGDQPYLRTFVEGVWTENLLSLPRY